MGYLEFWGPMVIMLLITGAGLYSYQRALGAWQSMLDPLSERVEYLQNRLLEMAKVLADQSNKINLQEVEISKLRDELLLAQKHVTALMKQVMDLGYVPNFRYIQEPISEKYHGKDSRSLEDSTSEAG